MSARAVGRLARGGRAERTVGERAERLVGAAAEEGAAQAAAVVAVQHARELVLPRQVQHRERGARDDEPLPQLLLEAEAARHETLLRDGPVHTPLREVRDAQQRDRGPTTRAKAYNSAAAGCACRADARRAAAVRARRARRAR